MEANFSKKVTFLKFLKIISPAIISMVFISFYTIVDGIFVSVLVGSDALASINIILPAINLIFGIGIMFAIGGSAIVSIMLGQSKNEEANKAFSFIFISATLVGIIISVLGSIFIKNIATILGATEVILPYAEAFGKIIILFAPIFIIKTLFEFFIRTDGNFNFSLLLSIISGIVNIIFDYIFISIFNFGVAGAALATGLGVLVAAIMGFYYFLSSKSNLKFGIPKVDFKLLIKVIINGSPELVTELSTGITTIIFNMLALKYAGEKGLAALTIILYAHFLMVSTYLGLVAGITPILSFNYGAKNIDKIKETYNYSKKFIIISSIIVFIISIAFSPMLVGIFVTTNNPVFNIALNGLKLFAIAFLFIGINVFASGLFTAFSNGKISAILALCRSFVFIIIGAAILPKLLNINGLWLTVPFAELLTILLSLTFLRKYKKIYHY
ncbi:putative efflux protein, MATE family [Clostridium cavendishii DSM 21758]|uniref:Multidrug export protein MepA n=1 Tax=Clostridium cavendishii DSM 21758 TaxID=1121302 RepID=A0A1M6DCT0_9CLOT|nr:MATE family efflux transporter [Clostridium cavendishii]SHI71009.1 putative efflux protein, MATE family [Clostridium cavendishii DSM 21758]